MLDEIFHVFLVFWPLLDKFEVFLGYLKLHKKEKNFPWL